MRDSHSIVEFSEEVALQAKSIFADVVDEFQCIPPILSQLNEWKQRYMQTYR